MGLGQGLIYWVEHADRLWLGADGRQWVRYRVELVYNRGKVAAAMLEAAGGHS